MDHRIAQRASCRTRRNDVHVRVAVDNSCGYAGAVNFFCSSVAPGLYAAAYLGIRHGRSVGVEGFGCTARLVVSSVAGRGKCWRVARQVCLRPLFLGGRRVSGQKWLTDSNQRSEGGESGGNRGCSEKNQWRAKTKVSARKILDQAQQAHATHQTQFKNVSGQLGLSCAISMPRISR